MNSLIDQFLSSLFITTQLLSAEDFDIRLASIINQTKSNAPITFNRLLSLNRIVNDGNAIISTYGTNFDYIQYIDSMWDTDSAQTRAVIYDDDCSCGLSSNCTTQAIFIEETVSEIVSIKGMKMGCTPSESFRLSTLECFYDQSCLDLIQQYTNYPQRIILLNQTMKRFSMNVTVNELINDAFVEEWKISINYTSHLYSCSPPACLLTFAQGSSIWYTIVFVVSLYGGLNVVLKWICPHIVRLIYKICQHRKRRIVPVQPISTIEMTRVDYVSSSNNNHTSRIQWNSSVNEALQYDVLLLISLIISWSIF